jgi:hypothetical protein
MYPPYITNHHTIWAIIQPLTIKSHTTYIPTSTPGPQKFFTLNKPKTDLSLGSQTIFRRTQDKTFQNWTFTLTNLTFHVNVKLWYFPIIIFIIFIYCTLYNGHIAILYFKCNILDKNSTIEVSLLSFVSWITLRPTKLHSKKNYVHVSYKIAQYKQS